jgi:hypothetical protein
VTNVKYLLVLFGEDGGAKGVNALVIEVYVAKRLKLN